MSAFETLAQQAETHPEGADFARLRAAYVDSPAYRPAKHIPQAKLLQVTNSASGFEEVAKTCEGILSANPLDLEARMMLAHAQEQLQHPQAERNHTYAERLLDAILATGDGKSFETAWHLVAENEAWTVMRVFGMKAVGQERHTRADTIIDVYTGQIGEREVQMYFDVTLPVRYINTHIREDE